MIDSKLFHLLKELSKEEFKELEKFVASPYFAAGRNFASLFAVIKPHYPEFNNNELLKEKLFRKLYVNEKYVPEICDNKIKILFSGFYKLCMEFLIYSGFKSDKRKQEFYLLEQLSNKKQYKEFQRAYSNSRIDNDEAYKGSIHDFIDKYSLRQILKNYSIDTSDFKKSFEAAIQMHEYFAVACLISCFKFENEKAMMEGYSFDYGKTLVSDLLDSLNLESFLLKIKENKSSFSDYINIYYTFYLMNNTKEEKHFFELKSLLKTNLKLFGRIELYHFWNSMCGYCSLKKRTTTGSMFEKEMFTLHKEMLQHNIYNPDDNQDFNLVMFRNIILNASILKEYKWLEDFVAKYSGEVNLEYRDAICNYSYALVSFGNGNFESALDFISKIKFDLYLYKLDVKTLLLKIYYELGYSDQLFSAADATDHYLRTTNEIPESLKILVKNFIKYLKELVKLKLSNKISRNDADYLCKSIERNKSIGSREWLVEKAQEFQS